MTNPVTPELLVASPEDLAYAAGLFEGEGCVGRPRGSVSLTINMCDVEPLEHMWRIVGGTSIRGPYKKPDPTHKPYFAWAVNGRVPAQFFYDQTWPWFSLRRRGQFELAGVSSFDEPVVGVTLAERYAYAAGLYEAEGTLTADKHSPRVQIRMGDREPLEWMLAAFGGNITGPFQPKNPEHKPMWTWYVPGWESFPTVRDALGGWLSPRRCAQLDRAIEASPPLESRGRGTFQRSKTHCPQGHEYNEENTSYYANGGRRCLTCHRERENARYHARQAEKRAAAALAV